MNQMNVVSSCSWTKVGIKKTLRRDTKNTRGLRGRESQESCQVKCEGWTRACKGKVSKAANSKERTR